MKFIKENSYDIVKLIINQVGIAIFSMMLYVSVALIEDAPLKATINVLVSVFSILFYYALIYTAAWDFGAKDKIKIDSGRLKKFSLKGALMGFYANLINFVVVGIAIICKLIHFGGGAEGFNFAFAILNALFRFAMSMYLGLINGIFSFITDIEVSYLVQSIGYFVIPVIAVAVTQLGYYLGSREIRILSLFSGKKSEG